MNFIREETTGNQPNTLLGRHPGPEECVTASLLTVPQLGLHLRTKLDRLPSMTLPDGIICVCDPSSLSVLGQLNR